MLWLAWSTLQNQSCRSCGSRSVLPVPALSRLSQFSCAHPVLPARHVLLFAASSHHLRGRIQPEEGATCPAPRPLPALGMTRLMLVMLGSAETLFPKPEYYYAIGGYGHPCFHVRGRAVGLCCRLFRRHWRVFRVAIAKVRCVRVLRSVGHAKSHEATAAFCLAP